MTAARYTHLSYKWMVREVKPPVWGILVYVHRECGQTHTLVLSSCTVGTAACASGSASGPLGCAPIQLGRLDCPQDLGSTKHGGEVHCLQEKKRAQKSNSGMLIICLVFIF